MPTNEKKILLFFHLFLLLFAGTSFSQDNLVLRRGGNVPFTINSFNKYEKGEQLDEWTRFDVFITGLGAADNWRLEVSTNDTEIKGDYYFHDLDLNFIQVKADAFNIEPGTAIINYYIAHPDFIELTYGPQILLSGTGNVTFQLNISYNIGTDTDKPLLGQPPGYYFVNLYFDLIADD